MNILVVFIGTATDMDGLSWKMQKYLLAGHAIRAKLVDNKCQLFNSDCWLDARLFEVVED